MLLYILPRDLILLIINECLRSLKDLCTLDAALTNKMLRQYFFSNIIPHLRIIKTVVVCTENRLIRMIEWKERREFDLKCIRFSKYDPTCSLGLPCIGNFFSNLKLISMSNCKFCLQNLLVSASLPLLEKLYIVKCIILFSSTIDECIPTAIKELRMESIYEIYNTEEDGNICYSLENCTKLYLWLTGCCPQLSKLQMWNCFGAYYMNVIPIVRRLTALEEFIFVAQAVSSKLLNIYPVNRTTFPLLAHDSTSALHCSLKTLVLKDNRQHNNSTYIADELIEILIQLSSFGSLEKLRLCVQQDTSPEYQELLLQQFAKIELWQHLTSLTFFCGWQCKTTPYWPFCLKNCKTLKSLTFVTGYYNGPIDTIACAPTTSILHLQCLHLNNVEIIDEDMQTICANVFTKQLTSLKLLDMKFLNIEAYHLIIRSFPQLIAFELSFTLPKPENTTKGSEIAMQLSIIELLDVLFSEQCVFAKVLQNFVLKVNEYFDFELDRDIDFHNDIFYNHMIKYWKFPYPQLKSFSFVWISAKYMAMTILLTRKILMSCPYLHTFLLNLGGCSLPVINVKNNPKKIRQIREIL